jgi:hypothetical protein
MTKVIPFLSPSTLGKEARLLKKALRNLSTPLLGLLLFEHQSFQHQDIRHFWNIDEDKLLIPFPKQKGVCMNLTSPSQ